MINLKYIPGDGLSLGIKKTGMNTTFSVAIGGTDEVLLKLFKEKADAVPAYTIKMDKGFRTGNIFSVTVKNFDMKGYTYLYEAKGVSFVDPYAHMISGREVYGKNLNKKARKLVRAYVWDTPCSMENDIRPNIDFRDLIIYKLHVRGFTMNTGGANKGTYKAVAEKISYLKELGVNAILLMPVMEYNEIYSNVPEPSAPEFVSSSFYNGRIDADQAIPENSEVLDPMGNSPEDLPYIKDSETKVNYWGYTSSYYFFAPKSSYASCPEQADREFKLMVQKLHKAGIEILMEVSIPKGTNRSMMLDALRYWVREYHVDGFKLNLDCIDSNLIACDPHLSSAKLIGNGWNTNEIYPTAYKPDSKTLGVYNDGYSVVMRRFLKSDEGMSGDVLRMFTDNSGDSINVNYITDHNGFTLNDLYSYDIKHNMANKEQGRDGTDLNYSWNCGEEGPTKSNKIRSLRLRMRKNAMAMLLLGQGVPMLFAGDEVGNSQGGNNNAYCQDNEVGWVNWKKTKSDSELQAFIKRMIKIRKEHPVLHNAVAHRNTDYLSVGIPDVSFHSLFAWAPDYNYYNRCIGIMYSGAYALKDHTTEDQSFYFAINMYWNEKTYEIPHLPKGYEWELLFSTEKTAVAEGEAVKDITLNVAGRSIAVLVSRKVAVKPPVKKEKVTEIRKEEKIPATEKKDSSEIVVTLKADELPASAKDKQSERKAI
ncbi:MAG: alpha-amylase [Lachnospiraceae bacterium]|nr:alpha-amylase [Lachnospiraceae bacterium]